MIALTILRAHWRKLAALLVLVVVFFAGRASVPELPARVEVREAEKLVEVEKVVEKRVEVRVRDEDQLRTVVVYRDRLTQPDGTVHEREEERSVTDTDVREVTRAEDVRVVEKEVVREVEKRVEVKAPRPSWRVGALAGVDFTRPPVLHPEGRVGFGAIVERRIVGPLSAGVWGIHTGTAGVLVTVEF